MTLLQRGRAWRALLQLIMLVLVGWTGLAQAEPPAKVPRIGVLWPGDIRRYDEAFRQGLRDQGYIEGQTILIEERRTNGHFERAPELAVDLVRLNVDVIFAVPTLFAKTVQQAVQQANKTIPIVFGPEFDPVGMGLVTSLARPGGTMTGLALVDPEFDAKQLEVLKETVPRLSRVVYLAEPVWNPRRFLKAKPAVEAAARAMGLRLQTVEVRSPQDLEGAFRAIVRWRAEAILVPISPLLLPVRHRIIAFAAKRRLPAMYGEALFVEDGGLMFYGAPYTDLTRRSAAIVARILKGARPADIPVEQPMEFKLIINLKTAKALGLTIPNEILFRADEILR